MKLMMLGSPGAGKGTQASLLSKYFLIPQISTGDMLRAAVQQKSELGRLADQYMQKGELVPDQIMVNLIKDRIKQRDCSNGFLLDGFPRTLEQAKALKEGGVQLDAVIELQVPEQEIIKRLSGRRVHLKSGRIYHEDYNPPKHPGLDNETGEPLIQREDDKLETIQKRLQIYRAQLKDLINYYQGELKNKTVYLVVDGLGNLEEVHKRILNALNQSQISKENKIENDHNHELANH